ARWAKTWPTRRASASRIARSGVRPRTGATCSASASNASAWASSSPTTGRCGPPNCSRADAPSPPSAPATLGLVVRWRRLAARRGLRGSAHLLVDVELHAAVLLPARIGVIGVDGLGRTVSVRLEPAGLDAVGGEVLHHAVGSLLAQSVVHVG